MKPAIKLLVFLIALLPCHTILAQIASTSTYAHPLEERAYLSTDKPYYYAGEKIWFKAYLNYRDRSRSNVLSRVLYVEWISPKNEVIETIILPISEGTSAGGLKIPMSTQPGTYRLRSYTNWMNNFSADNFAVRTIPVLDFDEIPVVDTTQLQTSSGAISLALVADQPSHRPKDLISVTLRLSENGKPVRGNFSLSVVDSKQVVPVNQFSNSQSILEAYGFKKPTEVQNHGVSHPIEYGLSIRGQYSEKGKKTKGAFAMVQGAMENMTVVETDPSGLFWITGLQFMDTSEIGFRHVNFKTGQGKIQFSPRYLPPVAPITAAELQVQKTTLAPRQELLYQLGADVTMLDEIYVTASPLQVSEAPTNVLGRADYKIDTKKLLRGSSTNLAEALVASIPGLMTYRSQDGFTFFFAEAQNFKEVATPLIILDGYQVTGDGFAWLSQINPATVKSVEVLRFGGASMFGLRAAGGVIIIESFNGGLDNTKSEFVTFDKGFFEKVSALGYTSAALTPFKTRDYRNPEQTGVDYRSTIYWNPNIQPDEKGVATVEFFAADEETNYQLIVEGVTEKGTPLRTTLKIPIVR